MVLQTHRGTSLAEVKCDEMTFYEVAVKKCGFDISCLILIWDQLQQSRRVIPVEVPLNIPSALLSPVQKKVFRSPDLQYAMRPKDLTVEPRIICDQ